MGWVYIGTRFWWPDIGSSRMSVKGQSSYRAVLESWKDNNTRWSTCDGPCNRACKASKARGGAITTLGSVLVLPRGLTATYNSENYIAVIQRSGRACTCSMLPSREVDNCWKGKLNCTNNSEKYHIAFKDFGRESMQCVPKVGWVAPTAKRRVQRIEVLGPTTNITYNIYCVLKSDSRILIDFSNVCCGPLSNCKSSFTTWPYVNLCPR